MTMIFNRLAMKPRRRELRNNTTTAEQVLWEHLRRKQIEGARFRRQYSIGAFVVDFYCPQLRLVIEVDGSIHEREDVRKKDQKRQKRIEDLKLRVIRFTNKEVMTDIQSVIHTIRDTVKYLGSCKNQQCGQPA
jgi:very-short-patch-repair endonuclease